MAPKLSPKLPVVYSFDITLDAGGGDAEGGGGVGNLRILVKEGPQAIIAISGKVGAGELFICCIQTSYLSPISGLLCIHFAKKTKKKSEKKSLKQELKLHFDFFCE